MNLIDRKLIDNAKKQLTKYPETNFKYRCKRRLLNIYRICKGQEIFYTDKHSWPNGLLAESLVDVLKLIDECDIKNVLSDYCDTWIKKKKRLRYLDHITNSSVLFFMFENEKDEKYRIVLDEMYNFLKEHEKDANESLVYRNNQTYNIYIDMIGMVCPFLYKYGLIFDVNEAQQLGHKQIENYYQFGIDEKTKLPYHGYNFRNKRKLGIIGWGRAVGWLLYGIVKSLEFVREDTEEYFYLVDKCRTTVSVILQYQHANGSFSWQLEAIDGEEDSSATAMILYAIQSGITKGILPVTYKQYVLKGVKTLEGYNKDGNIMQCSGECGGFGVYPQNYGSYPWALAFTLKLYVLLQMESVE